MTRLLRSAVLLSFASVTSSAAASAQCNQWSRRFFGPGTPGEVHAFLEFDDGSGSALFAAGDFLAIGPTSANRVAKWDGAQWSALGSGLEGGVTGSSSAQALAVFDDGSGSAIYAGGSFTVAGGVSASHIAKWDGVGWTALDTGVGGANATVRALTVFDDGSGSALFVGGTFTSAGGLTARGIAKWDGTGWSAVGGGIGTGGGAVYSLAVHDDGSGPALFMGGTFGIAGGASALCVAKWNGSSWSSVGGGMTGFEPLTNVNALAVHDDGSGPRLYAGGHFTSAGGALANGIARWDGASWAALGSGVGGTDPTVHSLFDFDDGSGSALYVGGSFATAGGTNANNIARWQASTWSSIGIAGSEVTGSVRALAAFDAGSGTKLMAGGDFTLTAHPEAESIAIFDGASWTSLFDVWGGVVGGTRQVLAMSVFDDGQGPALYAAGSFTLAGGVQTQRIARWNGSEWSPVGSGLSAGSISTMFPFDDGSGMALYAGGSFTSIGGVPASRIAKWDGATWSPVGSGVGGVSPSSTAVNALCAFDDGTGTALYACGKFTTANGSPANRIAKWDGATWSPLGLGVGSMDEFSFRVPVTMAVFDDGTGAALYVGGDFLTAGGSPASKVAKWDGSSWSAVGGGIADSGNWIKALYAFDDGTGSALYAGGRFKEIGGVSANSIAKWDGASWSALGLGIGDGIFNGGEFVNTLIEFDDGAGVALYVGGSFSLAGSAPASTIAKWDGSNWSTFGSGMIPIDDDIQYSVHTDDLAMFDDGSDGAPDLYASGHFAYVDGVHSLSIAALQGCRPGAGFCFGDGLDPIVTAQCPCGNVGAEGHGCANSNGALGGAELNAFGTTNPNTVVLTCRGVPNNSLCVFLRSNVSVDSGLAFGDGIRCVDGTTIRFGSQSAGQGGNPTNTVSSGAATVPSGNTRYYQVHYRNPNAAFCPPATFNISNGYRLAW